MYLIFTVLNMAWIFDKQNFAAPVIKIIENEYI